MEKFPHIVFLTIKENQKWAWGHTPTGSAVGESEAAEPQIQSQSKLQSKLKANLNYITKPCPQNLSMRST